MPPATLIAITLAVPLVGAVLIAACHRFPDVREAATLGTSALLFACVAALLPQVLDGARPGLHLIEVLPASRTFPSSRSDAVAGLPGCGP
jgi:multicomponent Na+:H+ antiporter subunit D